MNQIRSPARAGLLLSVTLQLVIKNEYISLDAVIKYDYIYPIATDKGDAVKQSEFRRWLESQGVEVRQGTNHLKLYYQGRQSTMPRHPGKEIGEGLRKAILKQLGIK